MLGRRRIYSGEITIINYHRRLQVPPLSVRYIDYGNRSDCLAHGDLYTWDTMLERIPPQAVSCSFYGAPEHIRDMTSLTDEDMEVFASLMHSSPMQMIVHQCLTDEDMFRHQTGPYLRVSLFSLDRRNILTKLSLLQNFLRPVPPPIQNCLKASNCPDHGNQMLFFCIFDEVPVCQRCLIYGDHQGHGAMCFYVWR